jgi:hypothetical protein
MFSSVNPKSVQMGQDKISWAFSTYLNLKNNHLSRPPNQNIMPALKNMVSSFEIIKGITSNQ